MGRWAMAIKHNLPKLKKQLDSTAFNDLIDHLYSTGLLINSGIRCFLKLDTDSSERQQNKVRELLLHVSNTLTKDRLRIFHDSLLEVELRDAAQLIKKYLPNSEECQESTHQYAIPEERQVKPQTDELEAISHYATTPSTESHSNGDTRHNADDQLPPQPSSSTVNQVACLQSLLIIANQYL